MAAVLARLIASKFHSHLHVAHRQSGRFSSTSSPQTRTRQSDDEKSGKMETIQSNLFYSKYADKIAALKKTDPEGFKVKLAQLSKSINDKTDSRIDDTSSQQFNSVTPPKNCASEARTTVVSPKLDDILKVNLMSDKLADEVSTIWKEFHLTQDYKIAAVIPVGLFGFGVPVVIWISLSCDVLFNNISEVTTVYNVPREQGFEFFVAQWNLHELHFTSLINYKTHQENAPECLTIMHFTDFQDDKGIVLMRGEYDKDVLTGIEAQCLVNQIQLYYNSKVDSERYRLLETFSKRPNDFQHDHLIKQLQLFYPVY